MASLDQQKKELFDYARLRLGDGIVDLEVDPAHLEVAYTQALQTYRQRAGSAYEESYAMIELKEGQNTYTLPQEVSHVRQVYRRTMGAATGPYSSSFDPFSQASLNVYLINYSNSGGLATYDFYTQYVELAAKMFGGFLNFTFNPYTKQLMLVRDPKGTGEPILIWTYNLRPEMALLADIQISPWLKNYTTAATKIIIGEAREKFSTIAGPQGGTSLNGAQMKAEGQAEIDKLLEDLKMYLDGSLPYSFIIG
jgi:hypothetical protein